MNPYNRYSEYLKHRYGEKVYKLPISINVTCPNRIGKNKGCSYCGKEGSGFENLSSTFSITEQLNKNKDYIGRKYNVNKYIAYFQSFTNTFLSISEFEKNINEASNVCDIVEIAISTRPDCVNEYYLDILNKVKMNKNINITIELGLQSVNYHTLKKINRCHTLAEYIDSILKIKSYDFQVCTHVILNLPWDNIDDVIECSKIISVLKTDYVKLHSLYIENDTDMASQYLNNDFDICSIDEYKYRVIEFLRYLSPDIYVQRIIGRAPKQNTIFSNWGTSWWKIHDEIVYTMNKNNYSQGDLYEYVNGSALKRFV